MKYYISLLVAYLGDILASGMNSLNEQTTGSRVPVYCTANIHIKIDCKYIQIHEHKSTYELTSVLISEQQKTYNIHILFVKLQTTE